MAYKVSVIEDLQDGTYHTWWKNFLSSKYMMNITSAYMRVDIGTETDIIINEALSPWNGRLDLYMKRVLEFKSEEDFDIFLSSWENHEHN